ncbi:MAG: hypothetical protein LC753_10810 [Acidobacteria bacterium]|nr:hypothetical protein [Acidobacteriota bacterium]MCA1650735.1 hypothetical protein [Acidobacteriota bacterium]
MRKTSIVIVLMLCGTGAAALQDKVDQKTPQKGDVVIVKGCLSGLTLDSTETTSEKNDGVLEARIEYRLTGKKELLKKLKDEHQHKIIEVTGVLKSTLAGADYGKGKQIGKTKIFIGGGHSGGLGQGGQPERPHDRMNQIQPVLEVRSVEGVMSVCGG